MRFSARPSHSQTRADPSPVPPLNFPPSAHTHHTPRTLCTCLFSSPAIPHTHRHLCRKFPEYAQPNVHTSSSDAKGEGEVLAAAMCALPPHHKQTKALCIVRSFVN